MGRGIGAVTGRRTIHPPTLRAHLMASTLTFVAAAASRRVAFCFKPLGTLLQPHFAPAHKYLAPTTAPLAAHGQISPSGSTTNVGASPT